MSTYDFTILVLAMGIAAYACRIGGFIAMRYVVITLRFEAALRATPLAVMTGIVTVAAMRGGPAEWLASACVLIVARLTGLEIVSALIGVVAIAMARKLGL